ncbi:hypothetical protein SCLCIDRAFT_135278, partial [Scleroderma citrinum Foug A]
WCVALCRDANDVAVGFNEGIVIIKLGPMYSMDPSGKLIYTCNQVVLSGSIQTLGDDATAEGNQISLSVKEISMMEIFATTLLHSPNSCFVTVMGDGEYIIYIALAYPLHGQVIRTCMPCLKTRLKCTCIRTSRREVALA